MTEQTVPPEAEDSIPVAELVAFLRADIPSYWCQEVEFFLNTHLDLGFQEVPDGYCCWYCLRLTDSDTYAAERFAPDPKAPTTVGRARLTEVLLRAQAEFRRDDLDEILDAAAERWGLDLKASVAQ